MSRITTVTKMLDRVAGEAKLYIVQDGERISDAFFLASMPVRGFEKLVLGKNPIFVVEAVMRICGICHAAHGIAATEAFEDALGILPPVNGRVLREAIGLLNRVQSHLIQLAMVLPDLLDKDKVRAHLIEAIRLLNMVNEVMTRIGGSATHPPNIAIGGIAKDIGDGVINECIRRIDEIRKRFDNYVQQLETSMDSEKTSKLTAFRLKDVSLLASHLYYGDRYAISIERIRVVRYEEYRRRNSSNIPSQMSLVALYGDEIVEVGPRARLTLYRGFDNDTLLGLQIARLLECRLCMERVKELLQRVKTSEPMRTRIAMFRRGRGVGVYEAPRGLLVHSVELDDDGRVVSYKIVVPTMFNIPVIEYNLRGAPIELAEIIVRFFDPCIPCTVHSIGCRGSRR